MIAHKNYGCVAYIDDPLPNIVYIAVWMPACIVWFYYKKKYCHGYEVLVTTYVFDKFGMQNMIIVGLVSYFIYLMDQ